MLLLLLLLVKQLPLLLPVLVLQLLPAEKRGGRCRKVRVWMLWLGGRRRR